jgi:hypothetical protein
MRQIRVVEYTAEWLEKEADEMPPSDRAQADELREQARKYRGLPDRTVVNVHEPGYWTRAVNACAPAG